MKKIPFKPEGCPYAGFYADLGIKILTPLIHLLNKSYVQYGENFEIEIDGSNAWKNFKDNSLVNDLYKEMFRQDYNKKIILPYTGIHVDHWTVIKNENFTSFNALLQKYFLYSDKQTEIYNSIITKYKPNLNKTIGVHYRGTDKHTEVQLASPSSYINLCKKILQNNLDYNILIQTDQAQVRDLFKQRFKDKCWFIEELPVTETTQGLHYSYSNKISLAKYMDIAVRILAKCKYLIVGTSNVATFIGAHRNNPRNVFQFNGKAELII